MRNVPTLPVNLEDQRLTRVLTEILKNLRNVLDSNIYHFEVVWTVPFLLSVPLENNSPRLTSPAVVEVKRAAAVNTPTVPVHFGATQWSWVGGNQVRVDDVDGLVAGTRYALTFQVTG